MSEDVVVRVNDGAAFNDPAAWGFCPWCAFDVAVSEERNIEHRRTRNGHDDARCTGSGRDTVRPTPRTAKALVIVSLRKTGDRARRKAYWQRQRFASKATARRRLAEMTLSVNPRKITVTSLATGEEIDLTDAIIGPVHLDMEEGDGEERDRP